MELKKIMSNWRTVSKPRPIQQYHFRPILMYCVPVPLINSYCMYSVCSQDAGHGVFKNLPGPGIIYFHKIKTHTTDKDKEISVFCTFPHCKLWTVYIQNSSASNTVELIGHILTLWTLGSNRKLGISK
jgi:hypothetical protein